MKKTLTYDEPSQKIYKIPIYQPVIIVPNTALLLLEIKSKIGMEMVNATKEHRDKEYINGLRKALEIVEQVEEEVLGNGVDCRKI